ncbi:YigZ family protein [Weissella coleopterorum]|uniref:YigZ family protein n=1 Tax=Weissella coleopterorum TaxID=2714949 RepID=A0A6G8B0D5_9LACO|nr:YigZ family protein [Weissella coleopterorum]QIL50675.1 YigZ family protein [Weissella coleopterorum]
MEQAYITIKQSHFNYEQTIKKSRFIVQMQRVQTEEEARNFIQQVKKEHAKANHNVWTYVLGRQSEIQRASDDGEPSGTAGTPMLEVLNNNHIKDVVVVQTRYFGGIKLGAGGLIRAYAGTLAEAVVAVGLVQRVAQTELVITIEYAQFERIKYWLTEYSLAINETNFTDQVSLIVPVNEHELDLIKDQLIDLTHGQVDLTIRGQIWNEIPFQRSINGQTKTRY